MADIDYKQKFTESDTYKLAVSKGIDISGFTVNSEDDYNKAVETLKNLIKEKENENTDDAGKQPQENVSPQKEPDKKEEETAKQERDTMQVEDKEVAKQEPQPTLSWIEEKKQFWSKYAADNALSADFEKPEEEQAPVYCKLSKGEETSGIVSYFAPNAAKISKDSKLKTYQGLVKDAVQNDLSITFGDSLNDHQKLMLYAAVLSSPDKYKNGDAIEATNPPALDKALLESEAFKNLDTDAQKVLQDEYNRRQQELQKQIDERTKQLQDKLNALRANLSPEQKALRDAKELDREKIMAARLGIAPHTTTYKAGPKKDEERKVEKDAALFDNKGNLNEKRISKEMFEHLKKTYGSEK